MLDKDNEYVPMITQHVIDTVVKAINKTWLKICLVLCFILFAMVLLNVTLFYQLTQKEIAYFATENGYVFPVKPTSQPVYKEKEINQFAASELSNALQLNFVHIDKQLSDAKEGFTQKGYDSFYKALSDSGLIQEVKSKKLSIKALISSGSLTTLGKFNGAYAWQFKYPLVLQKVNGDGSYSPVNYEALVQVIRVSTKTKPNGIGINQVILTPQ